MINNPRQIPIFQLEFSDEFITQYQNKIKTIFNSKALSEGTYVEKFERDFCKFVECEYAVATTSCTTALEIALRLVDVKGKDVILPTNTFVATAMAAKAAGGHLCLVDIESETFAIDPRQLKEKINENTGAVIIVHIGGIISKYIDEIKSICDNSGVPLIEDAAHAHGAKRKIYSAGKIGKIGCFSFFPTKVMTTGEGGIMTTQDKSVANELESLKNFGVMMDNKRTSRSMFVREGINGRMTEFQGLLGMMELTRVSERIHRRKKLANRYNKNLDDNEFDVFMMKNGENPHYKLIVETDHNVRKLDTYCKDNGVNLTGKVYETPIHKQPIFKHEHRESDFPVANQFAKHHFCPPLYPELKESDVDYACKVLNNAARSLS